MSQGGMNSSFPRMPSYSPNVPAGTGGFQPYQQPQYQEAGALNPGVDKFQTGGLTPMEGPTYNPPQTGGLTPREFPTYNPMQTGGLTPMGTGGFQPPPTRRFQETLPMGFRNFGMPPGLEGRETMPQGIQNRQMLANNYANVAGFGMPQQSPMDQYQALYARRNIGPR